MTERIRTTISLSPEAHEVFKRMAEAGNLSISRCMGDWLADTLDAAEMITVKMEHAKREPMRVVSELRAMVAGMVASVDVAESEVRGRSRSDSERELRRDGGAGAPPSSNTGVLSTTVPKKRVAKRPANWKTS